MPSAKTYAELIGCRVGRLLVTGIEQHKTSGRQARKYAVVQCDCGTTKPISVDSLLAGKTKSCGCLRREKIAKANTTHGCASGLRAKKEYRAWKSMIARCYIASATSYEYYGSRGIGVCERWRKDFEAFLSDVGTAPDSSYSIDRIDVNGNYEPSNCRWANIAMQQHNKRKRSGATSQYVGVSWSKRRNKWVATISDGISQRHLGYFADEHEAHLAYERRAIEIYGDQCRRAEDCKQEGPE